MNYKCPFCQRTFSRHSSYTRHVSKCILTVDSSNESNEDSNKLQYTNDNDDPKREMRLERNSNEIQSSPEVIYYIFIFI